MGTEAVRAQARRRILQACSAELDVRTLRLEVLAAIREAVPFDAYAWLVTDPETSVGASPLADVPCLRDLPSLIRLKYLTTVNRWSRMQMPVATLVRATAGDLSQSRLWRDMLHGYDVADIASVVFRDPFGCWGFLDLWRVADSAPFTGEDCAFLAGIARQVTSALRESQARTFTVTRAELAVPAGPVVLLLSPTLEVRAQTAQAQHYLSLLVPRDSKDAAPVPAGAYNVAGQLLANEAQVDDQPALARVHLADGVWLKLRAARMSATQRREADIAITIEVAAPADRLAIFVRACGLTGRETELLDHLSSGADTTATAARMFISEHTVQDHLKSIFAKTGSRSRRTLLARALGS